jgi:hypothetical protein
MENVELLYFSKDTATHTDEMTQAEQDLTAVTTVHELLLNALKSI